LSGSSSILNSHLENERNKERNEEEGELIKKRIEIKGKK